MHWRQKAIHTLKQIISCSYDKLPEYLNWTATHTGSKFNDALWSKCKWKVSSCSKPDFVSRICSESKTQIIKTTRLRMIHAGDLLSSLDPDVRKSVKILYLVRDPRAVMNSRRKVSWCRKRCKDPRDLCTALLQDHRAFLKFKSRMPTVFHMIRYEDLAASPHIMAKMLFQNLDLDFDDNVTRFILKHTQLEKGSKAGRGAHSISRDSLSRITAWVRESKRSDVQKVESACHAVMHHLHYDKMHSRESERRTAKKILQ